QSNRGAGKIWRARPFSRDANATVRLGGNGRWQGAVAWLACFLGGKPREAGKTFRPRKGAAAGGKGASRARAGKEHFQKYCSHSTESVKGAVFLVFGSRLRQGYSGHVVSAHSRGFLNPLLRQSRTKNQKFRLRMATLFFQML